MSITSISEDKIIEAGRIVEDMRRNYLVALYDLVPGTVTIDAEMVSLEQLEAIALLLRWKKDLLGYSNEAKCNIGPITQ